MPPFGFLLCQGLCDPTAADRMGSLRVLSSNHSLYPLTNSWAVVVAVVFNCMAGCDAVHLKYRTGGLVGQAQTVGVDVVAF